MLQRADIESLLDENGCSYSVAEHPAVFSIDELYDYDIPDRDRIAKNLFLRDDKKRAYYIISIEGSAKADLKELRSLLSSRPLSAYPPARGTCKFYRQFPCCISYTTPPLFRPIAFLSLWRVVLIAPHVRLCTYRRRARLYG